MRATARRRVFPNRCGSWGPLARPLRLAVLAILFFPILLFSSLASAQTDVSGPVATDTRWTVAGSPYRVSGEVTVVNGATLAIDPGVIVYMAAASSLVVQAGRVLAVGTSSAGIRVLSEKSRTGQGAPGDWNRWEFQAGSSGSRLEFVTIEHGRGLLVLGASPTFNFVDIRNHLGAAVVVDLLASPAGVGNQASGNSLNGIAVPAGDITASVRWGLRGIPYIVQAGTVSVGASPVVQSVAPSSLQVGESAELVLSGTRLAGAVSASSNLPGVELRVLPGGTDARFSLSATVSESAPVGAFDLRVLVDAGELEVPGGLVVRPREPRLDSVSPLQVYAQRGDQVLQIAGRNLRATTVAELDGNALATTVLSAEAATLVLPNQVTTGVRILRLRTPEASAPGGALLSNTAELTVIEPQPTLTPATVSVFQGNTQVMTLSLPFPAPAGGLVFSITSSAPLVASAQPTVTVEAGTSTAAFDIRGAGIGEAVIAVERNGWPSTRVPVTVIDPPRRLDLTPILSGPVGLQVGEEATPSASTGPHLAPPVGLSIGAAAHQLAPDAGVVGSTVSLVATGSGLGAVSRVDLVPSTGVTVSLPSGSQDGRQLSVQVTIAADAPKALRRVVLVTTGGDVKFARPGDDLFLVTSPAPELDSITPQVVVAGQFVTLTLRGRNLRDVEALRFDPPLGLRTISSPAVNDSGTQLEAVVQVDADAATGPRTVVVVAAGGESSSVPGASNTIQVARTTGPQLEALTSPSVGVQVGDSVVPVAETGPYLAAPVGIGVGTMAFNMVPNAGTQGTQVSLVVRGVGLGGVTGAQLVPDDGLVVGPAVVAPDGRQVSIQVAIDLNAPFTRRRLVLATASGVVAFADPAGDQFEVVKLAGTRFEAQSSAIVGVQVGDEAPLRVESGPFTARAVGLSVGAVALGKSPDAGVIGSVVPITVQGVGLAAVTAIEAVPGSGLVLSPPTVAPDGRSLVAQMTIAADAATDVRRIVLRTAGGEVVFADPVRSQFKVTVPVPVLTSITPQVVLAGGPPVTLLVRGRNLRDIAGVRFDPPSGLRLAGSPTSSQDGTQMQFAVQADAGAASGTRTLVVMAAAGESDAQPSPANTFQVARSVGGAFETIPSLLVGIEVGDRPLLTEQRWTQASSAGVLVGPAVASMSPAGSAKGVSGAWVFAGSGLQATTGIRLVAADGAQNPPDSGITVGTPAPDAEGRRVIVSYSVAATAPSRMYRVELLAGAQVLPSASPESALWEVAELPSIDSVAPNVLQQGRSYEFVVRGKNLRSVRSVVFEPGGGTQMSGGSPLFETDAFGEKLTVRLLLSADAAIGPRVVRLQFPGGLTSNVPTAANVVDVTP